MNKVVADHSIQDVYSRLGQVEQDVAGIRPLLKQLSEDVGDIKRQRSQPTNWIGIGSLIIAVLLYMNTTQAPLDDRITKMEAEVNKRTEITYSAPTQLDEVSKKLESVSDRITALDSRIWTLETKSNTK